MYLPFATTTQMRNKLINKNSRDIESCLCKGKAVVAVLYRGFTALPNI